MSNSASSKNGDKPLMANVGTSTADSKTKSNMDANPNEQPKGKRDSWGQIIYDEVEEIEEKIESYLPDPVENVLKDLHLAGKPFLVVLLVGAFVYGAWKFSQ